MKLCKNSLTIIIESLEDIITAVEAGFLTDDEAKICTLKFQLSQNEKSDDKININSN